MRNSTLLPFDTEKDSAIRQLEILQNMDINARAMITFELSDNLRSITESGIHDHHPNYTQEQIKQASLSIVVEREILEQAFYGCEVST
jgi:hypothetical protein